MSTYMLADAFLWAGFNTIILPKEFERMVSRGQLSLLVGLVTFSAVMTGTLANIFAGVISDRAKFRMGRRRPFMIFGAIMTLAALALAWSATGLVAFIIGYFVLQIGENIAAGSYYGLLPDLVPTEKTGSASGILTLFQFVGNLTGYVATGYLVGTAHLDTALMLEVAIILGAMVVTVFGIRERQYFGNGRTVVGGIRASFGSVPKNLFLLLISRFFALLGTNTLTFFSLFYVSQVLGIQKPEFIVATMGGAVLLLAMFSSVSAGYFSGKVDRKRLAIAACSVGSFAMLVLAFVPSVTGLMVAGGMLGVCMGMFMTATLALSSDLAPEGMGGTAMGLWNLAIGSSQAVSPGVAGLVIYLTQNLPWSGMGYKPLFLLASVYFVVAVAFIRKVEEKVKGSLAS